MILLDMNCISIKIYLNSEVEKQCVSVPSPYQVELAYLYSSLVRLPARFHQPVLGRLGFCRKVTNQVRKGLKSETLLHPPERGACLSGVHRKMSISSLDLFKSIQGREGT